MRIIISPAKRMNIDTDSLPAENLPIFLSDSEKLQSCLKSMSYDALKKLWNCNDAIAERSYRFLQKMDLKRSLTPAILSFEGIQYQYMAPSVFENNQLQYIEQHLRILSGFYGLLRPFDGVVPYRLEMQARLSVENSRNLYAFWNSRLAERLISETDFILNLASQEYSKAVLPYLPEKMRVQSCLFGELKDGRLVEKGTLCKMARGEMVRFLAENQITDFEGIKQFDHLGYTFSKALSSENTLVFVMNNKK